MYAIQSKVGTACPQRLGGQMAQIAREQETGVQKGSPQTEAVTRPANHLAHLDCSLAVASTCCTISSVMAISFKNTSARRTKADKSSEVASSHISYRGLPSSRYEVFLRYMCRCALGRRCGPELRNRGGKPGGTSSSPSWNWLSGPSRVC
ncbi:uncharacterized protein [Dermacentor andersoni]|uniref:uncharacterized protein n=1 Tax=Dermacentor andersoni TaxID=34620 RepID=UPI003B3A205D